jgi:hypothetical protein
MTCSILETDPLFKEDFAFLRNRILGERKWCFLDIVESLKVEEVNGPELK